MDTMHGRCKSVRGNHYSQIFGNKDFFVAAYPMRSKKEIPETVKKFFKDYGVPDTMIFDSEGSQRSEATANVFRQNDCETRHSEPGRPNQNPAEACIREFRKKWYRLMFKTNCPKRFWCYGHQYIAAIMQRTATWAGDLEGRCPLEKLTGDTIDISEYLDFGFYDWVSWKEDAGCSETLLGKWLGVAYGTGSLMSYWVLKSNGEVECRTTVQRLTEAEKSTESIKEKMKTYSDAINAKFKSEIFTIGENEPTQESHPELFEDPDFMEEFHRIYSMPDVADEEEDTFDPELTDADFLGTQFNVDRGGESAERVKVTKRMRNNDGTPIGTFSSQVMNDTRLFELEFHDGEKTCMTANNIASSILDQVDGDGNQSLLLDAILDVRYTKDAPKYKYLRTSRGIKRRTTSTKGVNVLIQWKDGTTSWHPLKDIKECMPVQMAHFAVERGLDKDPAFAFWIPQTLRLARRMISKVKTKYWDRTHKYGIKLPKDVTEARQLDFDNKNTLWWDDIQKEMRNVRPRVERYDGDVKDLVGYQEVKLHFIFDIKIGENFRRKARLVAGGHKTDTPASLTYSSVVSRDSVRILLTIAALNDLDVLACDIQNAYLTAPCREKIWFKAGPEFGEEQGCIFIVRGALYGLKSSGAAFRTFLANHLHKLGFRSSLADPDVWMRPGRKPKTNEPYWEYVLCYVDDVLAIHHDPIQIINGIKKQFKLKGDKAEEPDIYLGAKISKVKLDDGSTCWSLGSEKYLKAAIETLETTLKKKGQRLPGRCPNPFSGDNYHPGDDVTAELNREGIKTYQELIGILRWAIEIGRLDILLEVSLLSQHSACPRVGHLEQVYHIFGYLKKSGKRTIYLDPRDPMVSEERFKKHDWADFYRDCTDVPPPNMPTPKGKPVRIHCFVDANHASDKSTRRSQTGVLLFINRAPIMWHCKRQNGVEVSTFGSEFMALKTATEMIIALRYKLRMFGIPLEGDGAANIYCDNEAVWKNSSTPESVLSKKQHSIAYHYCRQAVAAGITRIAKEPTETNLADLFTKVLTSQKRNDLLDRFMY
jgi:hypothetical protein